MKRRKKSAPRISRRFASIMKAEEQVETDLKYWAVHALHWNAFLFAVIGVFTVGYTLF